MWRWISLCGIRKMALYNYIILPIHASEQPTLLSHICKPHAGLKKHVSLLGILPHLGRQVFDQFDHGILEIRARCQWTLRDALDTFSAFWPHVFNHFVGTKWKYIRTYIRRCYVKTTTPIRYRSAVANIIYRIFGGVAGAPKDLSRRLELF